MIGLLIGCPAFSTPFQLYIVVADWVYCCTRRLLLRIRSLFYRISSTCFFDCKGSTHKDTGHYTQK